MKAIFIFPPTWNVVYPSTGIPTLMGILAEKGVQCQAYDLNVDFYNHILSSFYVKNCFEKARNIVETEITKHSLNKINYIKNQLSSYNKYINTVLDQISDIKICNKVKNFFYNSKYREYSAKLIQTALDIISLPYYPYKIELGDIHNLENKNLILDYEYANFINDKSINIFSNYFEKKLNSIEIDKDDVIFISINSRCQMLAGLTFASMIKNRYQNKVAIGGTWVDFDMNNIKADIGLFNNLVDYCMFGQGDIQILQMWEHLTGQREISGVQNIIYLQNNRIIVNNKSTEEKIKIDGKYNYNGYNFVDYFVPEPMLPIKVSYGCYWAKCTFCNYDLDHIYRQRDVESVIQEIKLLQKQYHIRYFIFQDAALSPDFIENFSEEIIKEKIEIRYSTNLRFENQYNQKLLKQLYKSGLRIAQWGLESASDTILKKMNKGINIDRALRILKDAHKAKIFNHLYLIYDFPGETMEDFNKTIDFLKNNNRIIQTFCFHRFHLIKNTYIYNHLNEFYTKSDVTSQQKLLEIKNNIINNINNTVYNKIFNGFDDANLIILDRYPIR